MDITAAVISCMFGFIIPPFYPPQFPSVMEGLGTGLNLRARVLRIPLQTADVPVIGLQRLLATRVVTLSQEVNLVLGESRQILATIIDESRDALESLTSPQRVRAIRLHEVRLVTQIDAVTRIARCRSPTVRRQQHSTMFVRGFLSALAQCAGYIVNTGLGTFMQHSHPQHSLVVGGNAMPLEDFYSGDIENLL